MKNILTLGGSNSRASISKQLAEYAGNLVEGVAVKNIDLNDYAMPLFSVDVEAEDGFPATANSLNQEFAQADGFIIALAEHNGAYSAAFKNMFDWLSRIEGGMFRGKPLLLLSTSPGGRGGLSVLEIALERFPRHAANITGSLSVPFFNEKFDEGKLIDNELDAQLKHLVEVFEKQL